jgi:hypothetical protein
VMTIDSIHKVFLTLFKQTSVSGRQGHDWLAFDFTGSAADAPSSDSP